MTPLFWLSLYALTTAAGFYMENHREGGDNAS